MNFHLRMLWAAILLINAVVKTQGLVQVQFAKRANMSQRVCTSLGFFSGDSDTGDPLTSTPSDATGSQSKELRKRNRRIPDEELRRIGLLVPEVWSETLITLPFEGVYEIPDDEILEGESRSKFQIRLLRFTDIPRIVDLCYQEYGEYTAQQRQQEVDDPLFQWQHDLSIESTSPWSSPLLDGHTLDALGDQLLKPYVGIALASKCLVNTIVKMTTISSTDPAVAEFVPNDNVCLVLTLDRNDAPGEEDIVGFVDLTQQAIQPEHNPSIFPTPLTWKQLTISRGRKFGGWITNLLIAPEHRGQGWSKVLVAACEQIARQRWNLESMHLHCSAHPQGGLVPQRLYLGIGYTPGLLSVEDVTEKGFEWFAESPTGPFPGTQTVENRAELASAIYVIDQVPLVFMSKSLV